eukprot:3481744-Pleurochrysis_carterae.AAC.1
MKRWIERRIERGFSSTTHKRSGSIGSSESLSDLQSDSDSPTVLSFWMVLLSCRSTPLCRLLAARGPREEGKGEALFWYKGDVPVRREGARELLRTTSGVRTWINLWMDRSIERGFSSTRSCSGDMSGSSLWSEAPERRLSVELAE